MGSFFSQRFFRNNIERLFSQVTRSAELFRKNTEQFIFFKQHVAHDMEGAGSRTIETLLPDLPGHDHYKLHRLHIPVKGIGLPQMTTSLVSETSKTKEGDAHGTILIESL